MIQLTTKTQVGAFILFYFALSPHNKRREGNTDGQDASFVRVGFKLKLCRESWYQMAACCEAPMTQSAEENEKNTEIRLEMTSFTLHNRLFPGKCLVLFIFSHFKRLETLKSGFTLSLPVHFSLNEPEMTLKKSN